MDTVYGSTKLLMHMDGEVEDISQPYPWYGMNFVPSNYFIESTDCGKMNTAWAKKHTVWAKKHTAWAKKQDRRNNKRIQARRRKREERAGTPYEDKCYVVDDRKLQSIMRECMRNASRKTQNQLWDAIINGEDIYSVKQKLCGGTIAWDLSGGSYSEQRYQNLKDYYNGDVTGQIRGNRANSVIMDDDSWSS